MNFSDSLSEADYGPFEPQGRLLANADTVAEINVLAHEAFNLTAGLIGKVRRFIERYLVLSDVQSLVLAVWVLHTWAFDAADATPYLHISAPEKGCGKTRLLEVLGKVVRKPWMTGRVSAAVLVRKVDAEQPTLLLDESDAAFNGAEDYTEALRGILNSGFKRNGVVSLCVGKGADISYKDFSCFGPKAIAGIGTLPDTIASRSIPIAMRRKTQDERVQRFREREAARHAAELVGELERWASSDRVRALKTARPALPDPLSDREQDICEPLLAIADSADSDIPERVRKALMELFRSSAGEDGSTGTLLLKDLRSIFDDRKTDNCFSADLANDLCKIEGRPWADWAHGKGMDANRLAKQLRKYSISPRTVRVGTGTGKGYPREDFEDAWSRYCPVPLSRPSGAVTSETGVTDPVNAGDSEAFEPSHRSHTSVTLPSHPASSQSECDATEPSHFGERSQKKPEKTRVVTDVTCVTAFLKRDTDDEPELLEGLL